MKITNRVIAACIAIPLCIVALRVTQPASHPGSPGATSLTTAISFAFLALSVLTAYHLSQRRSWARRRSVGSASVNLLLAALPLGLLVSGAVTGWIHLVGRYGMTNYSVTTSPIGYCGTFAIYAFVVTVVLSWAFADLRSGDAA